MPHILVKEQQIFSLPQKVDEVFFEYIAKGDSEDKILVKVADYRFLLTKIKKGELERLVELKIF